MPAATRKTEGLCSRTSSSKAAEEASESPERIRATSAESEEGGELPLDSDSAPPNLGPFAARGAKASSLRYALELREPPKSIPRF